MAPRRSQVESDHVSGSRESVQAQERLDELRRRLYRDGAGEEDLRRYAEVRDSIIRLEHPGTGAQVADAPAPDAAPPIRARRPRRVTIRVAAFALAPLLVVGVGVGVAAAASPARPHTAITPTPTPHPATTAAPQDIGDGQTIVQQASVVAAPAAESVSIDGTVAQAQQFEGVGDAWVPLDVSSAGFSGGRGVVVLSSSAVSPIDWRTLRLATRRDWTSYQEVIAQGTVLAGSPVPSPVLFSYSGAPPTHLAIGAPRGLRWTLLVVFLGSTRPAKR
jgi:hypothetical protein